MDSKIFDKKNVLVTGGAGFIGSHLCDELVKENKVICLDNFLSGDEKNIDHLLREPNFVFIKADINEPIDLETFPELEKFKMKFQGIQEIYHLACPTSPKTFDADREAIMLANSLGMKNVLDLAKKYNSKFLHFSSSVVYGERKDNEKISEDYLGEVDALSKRSVYDEGKRFSETMVKTYRDIFGLDTKILRVFRVYGSRMKLGEGHMVPDFVNDALENKDVTIFGDESFSSSLCYVGDVVDAALKMMASDEAGPFNIGSDIEIKIADVAKKIIEMLGSKSGIRFSEKMLFMTPLPLPNIKEARERLDWIPVVTLDKGLENTIEHLRASKGLKGVHNII